MRNGITKTDVPIHGVAIAGTADLTDDTIVPKADVKYALTVTNTGNINDTIKLATNGNADAALSQTSISLAPGKSSIVTLTIPGTVRATVGKYVAKVTVTSESDGTKTAQIETTTTVKRTHSGGK